MKRFAALFTFIITILVISCDTNSMIEKLADGKNYITYINATKEQLNIIVWNLDKTTGNPDQPYEFFYMGEIKPGEMLRLQQNLQKWCIIGYIKYFWGEEEPVLYGEIQSLGDIIIKISGPRRDFRTEWHGKFIDLSTGDYIDI